MPDDRDEQYAREARIKLQERDNADKANTNAKGDEKRGASHHKRNASLGKKRSGPLGRGGSGDPSEDPTAPLGGGLYGWPSDNDGEDAERGVREEPEGAVDPSREPSAFRSWGRYFAQNPLLAAACALLVVLAVVGALSLAGIVKGGPAPSEHSHPAKKTKAAGAASRDASLGKAYDAGTLRVSRQSKDALSISVAPGGGTYTETAKKGSRDVVLKSGKGDDYASFDSPYSESGARAYGGHLSESLGTNVIVDARPEFDPGKAAASGWVPIAGGRYTVKARDGSFSASGDYSDTLVGTATVERTYNETYIRNTTGATHPHNRSFLVRYSIEGDKDLRLLGIALNPTLIGYRVPDGVKSD